MPKKRIYTVSELVRNTKLFKTAVPFDVTSDGVIVCSVVKPGGVWKTCEGCGENTQNVLQFQNKKGVWEELILCDQCGAKLL